MKMVKDHLQRHYNYIAASHKEVLVANNGKKTRKSLFTVRRQYCSESFLIVILSQ